MKTSIRLAAVAALCAMFTGCEQLNPKPDTSKDEKKTNGGSTSGGGGAAAQPDMRGSLNAISPMPGWPKDTSWIKDGFWIERKMASPGYNATSKWVIVGTAGDQVKVEYQGGETFGYIEALVVEKGTGKVTKAQAARKGEKLADIKIQEMPTAAGGEAPTGTDEDVEVKAGKFKTKKYVTKSPVAGQPDFTSWVGTEGDAEGVTVKYSDGKNTNELAEVKWTDVKVGDKTYKARYTKMSNGDETTWIKEPVPFSGGVVKSVTSGTTMEYTWGEGGKPELDWK